MLKYSKKTHPSSALHVLVVFPYTKEAIATAYSNSVRLNLRALSDALNNNYYSGRALIGKSSLATLNEQIETYNKAYHPVTLSVTEKAKLASSLAASLGLTGDLSKVYDAVASVKQAQLPKPKLVGGNFYVHKDNPDKVYLAVKEGNGKITLRSLSSGGAKSSLPEDALEKGIIIPKEVRF